MINRRVLWSKTSLPFNTLIVFFCLFADPSFYHAAKNFCKKRIDHYSPVVRGIVDITTLKQWDSKADCPIFRKPFTVDIIEDIKYLILHRYLSHSIGKRGTGEGKARWRLKIELDFSDTLEFRVMGFPSFSGVSTGLLVLINTVLSVQSVKDVAKSLMRILGLFFTSAADNVQINSRSNQLLRREYSNSNPETFQENAPGLGSELAQLPAVADEIRQNLPVVPYQTPANNTHVGECAVCLCKFEEGDQIRELPCSHFFHRICLDKWLDHQQTTCPLCRFSLIPEETAIRLRRREQELTEELMFWFSSFHGHGFHSMWWLR